jgi:hypothetical protein
MDFELYRVFFEFGLKIVDYSELMRKKQANNVSFYWGNGLSRGLTHAQHCPSAGHVNTDKQINSHVGWAKAKYIPSPSK